MRRDHVADLDAFLTAVHCPPHTRTAVLALRDHIATCGPTRWKGGPTPQGWSLRASVGGRVICHVTSNDSGVGVRALERAPQPVMQAIAAKTFSKVRTRMWSIPVESTAELFPLVTRAYALAKAHPLGTPRPAASA